MPSLKIRLSYLILGQKGGKNRIEIIKLLNDRPYNLNQLADMLGVNYRTVKHHIDVLVKNEIVSSSKTGGYGDVYFLTPEMEGNMDLFEGVLTKLSSFTTSPGFFQNIMEQTNDAVLIVSREREILFWNKSARVFQGYHEGQKVDSAAGFFQEPGHLEELIGKVEAGGEVVGFETVFRRLDGTPFDVSLTMNRIVDENEEMLGYSILYRDITDMKRNRTDLEKLNRIMEGMLNITEHICSETTREGLLGKICEEISRNVYKLVWVGLCDEETKNVVPMAQAGFEAGYLDTILVRYDDSEYGRGPTGMAIKTGLPQVMASIDTDPAFAPWREQALKRGYRSSAAVPISLNGRIIGALNVYSERPDAFEERELKLLQKLSNDISISLRTLPE